MPSCIRTVKRQLWTAVATLWLVIIGLAMCVLTATFILQEETNCPELIFFGVCKLIFALAFSVMALSKVAYKHLPMVKPAKVVPLNRDDAWERRLIDVFNRVLYKSRCVDDVFPLRICLRYDHTVNALASREENRICVNSGCVWPNFTDEEFEGLLSHELGHIIFNSGSLRTWSFLVLSLSLAVFLMPLLSCALWPLFILVLMPAATVAFWILTWIIRMDERACDQVAIIISQHRGLPDFLARLAHHPGGLIEAAADDDPAVLDAMWGKHHFLGSKASLWRRMLEHLYRTHDQLGVRVARLLDMAEKRERTLTVTAA